MAENGIPEKEGTCYKFHILTRVQRRKFTIEIRSIKGYQGKKFQLLKPLGCTVSRACEDC